MPVVSDVRPYRRVNGFRSRGRFRHVIEANAGTEISMAFPMLGSFERSARDG